MKYTVRFAHLKHKSCLRPGDTVRRGDVIGIMGNTGSSTGAHLHMDNAQGEHRELWKLSEVDPMCKDTFMVWPHLEQINYHVDNELWGFDNDSKEKYYTITTYYGDPRYLQRFKKWHCGYDIVVIDDANNDEVYWNRSADGVVTYSGFDDGYGYAVMIAYEV
jgi:hypothetical protein